MTLFEKLRSNILAGAEQQGDDDKDYKVIPSKVIYDPKNEPYLTVMEDDKLIRIRLHKYDIDYRGGLFFTIDKKAKQDLIDALSTLGESD